MLPCRYAAMLIDADDFRHYCHCSPMPRCQTPPLPPAAFATLRYAAAYAMPLIR
jgi:hypothetical protein